MKDGGCLHALPKTIDRICVGSFRGFNLLYGGTPYTLGTVRSTHSLTTDWARLLVALVSSALCCYLSPAERDRGFNVGRLMAFFCSADSLRFSIADSAESIRIPIADSAQQRHLMKLEYNQACRRAENRPLCSGNLLTGWLPVLYCTVLYLQYSLQGLYSTVLTAPPVNDVPPRVFAGVENSPIESFTLDRHHTGHARINSHVHSVVIVLTYLGTELLHGGHTCNTVPGSLLSHAFHWDSAPLCKITYGGTVLRTAEATEVFIVEAVNRKAGTNSYVIDQLWLSFESR
jgi:hypothetical protein